MNNELIELNTRKVSQSQENEELIKDMKANLIEMN